MATLKEVVFDCEHPASLARFWADLLEGYDLRPYDEAEIERLRGIGITDLADDPSVCIDSSSGPTLFFQRVPERKTVKNRVHLDLSAEDRAAEAQRIAAIGGRMLHEFDTWTVFADLEGNEFCVADG